jgi:uncharacterized protein YjbI with pentapeptide repeats
LPGVGVVDNKELAKIEKATSQRKLPPWDGLRTRDFSERNLNCSDFSNADLRRVDFSGAEMVGAKFTQAYLEGASFIGSQLEGAVLDEAFLQQASLEKAELQGASLVFTQLQGASLNQAQLQGALFAGPINGLVRGAQLQGASLRGAQLQGASLTLADLQGASLDNAQLQGAAFGDRYQAGDFPLPAADLRDVSMKYAQLQGTTIGDAYLTNANLEGVNVWRTNIDGAECKKAEISNHTSTDFLQTTFGLGGESTGKVHAEPREIENFIEHSLANVPPGTLREAAIERMDYGLLVDPSSDDTAAINEVWNSCERAANEATNFDNERLQDLRQLVCKAQENRDAIGAGIVRNWISDSNGWGGTFSEALAMALLGKDGTSCDANKDFDEGTLIRLLTEAANWEGPPVPRVRVPAK